MTINIPNSNTRKMYGTIDENPVSLDPVIRSYLSFHHARQQLPQVQHTINSIIEDVQSEESRDLFIKNHFLWLYDDSMNDTVDIDLGKGNPFRSIFIPNGVGMNTTANRGDDYLGSSFFIVTNNVEEIRNHKVEEIRNDKDRCFYLVDCNSDKETIISTSISPDCVYDSEFVSHGRPNNKIILANYLSLMDLITNCCYSRTRYRYPFYLRSNMNSTHITQATVNLFILFDASKLIEKPEDKDMILDFCRQLLYTARYDYCKDKKLPFSFLTIFVN